MGPMAMAKEQCANMRPNGGCLGVPVKCLVSDCPPMAAPLSRCKLAEKGKRCEYFERVVVPLANSSPEKYAEAVEIYSAGRANNALAVKDVRLCECGAPLAKRKRLCPACARRKRREAARNGMAKLRGPDVSS